MQATIRGRVTKPLYTKEFVDPLLAADYNQGYIEPHTATARWDLDGRITIWDSSQGHFSMRDLTALVLDLPVSQIKVVPMGAVGRQQRG